MRKYLRNWAGSREARAVKKALSTPTNNRQRDRMPVAARTIFGALDTYTNGMKRKQIDS